MSDDANLGFEQSEPFDDEHAANSLNTQRGGDLNSPTKDYSFTGEYTVVPQPLQSHGAQGHNASHATAQHRATNQNFTLTRVDSSSAPPFNVPVLSQASLQQNPPWSAPHESQSVLGAALESLLHTTKHQIQRTLSDQVTPVRLAGHFSILVVAAAILIISQIEMPDWDVSLRAFPTTAPEGSTMAAGAAVSQVSQMLAGQSLDAPFANSSLQRAIVPFTIIPEQPQEEIQTYVVQPGDTVLGIARQFGLKPESIQWANSGLEMNPDVLRVGDVLNILPIDGALHTVVAGDTLSSIADKYKVSMEDIVNYPGNAITDPASGLIVGAQVVIPGGVKPYVPPQVFAYNTTTAPATATKGTGAFVWPTSGSVTQRFWGGHPAIDIGSWTGAPVKAADSGHVILAQSGYNNGYGNHVMIDHGNGFVSLYAHLNSFYVRVGENISRGQQIGTVGNTGNSTGPHLHLEIRYQGVPRNPFSYLN